MNLLRKQGIRGLGVTAFALCILSGVVSAQSVCGNGTVEPGEQCDVAATPSGMDECDGCAIDCTITEECGIAACEDGIDNDGNNAIDAADPSCAALADLQALALVSTGDSFHAMTLRRAVRVSMVGGRDRNTIVPYPVGESHGDICGSWITVDGLATLEGSLTATAGALFQQRDAAGIGGRLVVTDPWRLTVDGVAPLVGAPTGSCSKSGNACLTDLDCARRETCEGREEADAGNGNVDLTGKGSGRDDLQRCRAGVSRLADLSTGVVPVSPTASRIELSGDHNQEVLPVGPGLTVLHFRSMWIGAQGSLTIDGPTDAVVVVSVDGALRVLGGAKVQLSGGIKPQNVLWLFNGKRPNSLSLGVDSVFNGTILAPQRHLRLHRNSLLHGAAYSRNITMQAYSRVEHVPFTAQLPATVHVDTQSARANGVAAYESTVTNSTPYTSPATTVTIPLAAGEHFVSATPSQGTCVHDGAASGGIVTCFLGALPGMHNGQAKSVSIHVDAD